MQGDTEQQNIMRSNITVPGFIGSKGSNGYKYTYLRYLSHGSSAETWEIMEVSTGTSYALKITSLRNRSPSALLRARTEIRCLESVNHFACIRLHDKLETESNLFLIMEYCDAGDLRYQLRIGEPLLEHQITYIMLQLILAIHYMHTKKKMLHRDIKPANILLKTKGFVKIGDFGLSNTYDTISGDVGSTICGTPAYVAPELWRNEKYGAPADLWSLGVVFYEIMTGRLPFRGVRYEELRNNVLNETLEPIETEYNEELKRIVYALLRKSSSERPDTIHLLRDTPMAAALCSFPEVLRASNIDELLLQQVLYDISPVQLQPRPRVDPTVYFIGTVWKFKSPTNYEERQLELADGHLTLLLRPGARVGPKGRIPLQNVEQMAYIGNDQFALKVMGMNWSFFRTPQASEWEERLQAALRL